MYESPCQSSQESVDSERWEDPLGQILGGPECRGRLRGLGYGAPWKECFPESPELAKQRRRSRKESITYFRDVVQDVVARALQERGLGQGLPPLHPVTEASPSSVEGFAHGLPSPIDNITVSFVDSTPSLE